MLVAASGPDLAYWLNAASFVLSAGLLLRIPARAAPERAAESHGHWRDVAEGFQARRGSRVLTAVLVSWNLVMLAIALVNVAEVFLAKVSFDAGDFGFGLMWAASGVGACRRALRLVGARAAEHDALSTRASIALMAFGDIAAALSPNVWVAIWCILARRHRKRDRDRLQLAARPARRARPSARPRLHGADRRELRRARGRDGRWPACCRRGRASLGLRDRRLVALVAAADRIRACCGGRAGSMSSSRPAS